MKDRITRKNMQKVMPKRGVRINIVISNARFVEQFFESNCLHNHFASNLASDQ